MGEGDSGRSHGIGATRRDIRDGERSREQNGRASVGVQHPILGLLDLASRIIDRISSPVSPSHHGLVDPLERTTHAQPHILTASRGIGPMPIIEPNTRVTRPLARPTWPLPSNGPMMRGHPGVRPATPMQLLLSRRFAYLRRAREPSKSSSQPFRCNVVVRSTNAVTRARFSLLPHAPSSNAVARIALTHRCGRCSLRTFKPTSYPLFERNRRAACPLIDSR